MRAAGWPPLIYTLYYNYHGVLQLDVRVRYRTPTLYRVRNTGKLLAKECPPSTPIRLHTLPCAWAALISATRHTTIFYYYYYTYYYNNSNNIN